jgi:hypothetical protein
VTLRVKDSGIGIKRGLLAAIFDMFVQADSRLEREGGGLGIGLTLVRHFVQMHRGTISVTSAGPNLGSEFVVTTSGGVAHDRRERRSSHRFRCDQSLTRRVCASLSSTTIATVRRRWARSCKCSGNVVTTANAGSEALQRVAESPPDVALLDIGMPS